MESNIEWSEKYLALQKEYNQVLKDAIATELKYKELNTKAKIQESAIELLAEKHLKLRARCEKMEAALTIVRDWKLPPTGQFWDDAKTSPMSYGACYGSNGERVFMRHIANKALKEGESNTPAISDDPEWIKWLSDGSPNVPDLTECNKEEKQELVNALFQASGGQFMKMFYAIGLENMMESGMVNDSTGDLFRLRFELIQKGNTPALGEGEKEVGDEKAPK